MNKYSTLASDPQATLYDAGGGEGKEQLDFPTLSAGQHQMFLRTINQLSDFEKRCRAQENRQVTVVDTPIQFTISISREDFPDVTARFDIHYVATAAQQAWGQLIKDIIKKLRVDFVHSLLDKADKSPVWRITRLIPNGEYLVRQRESSAVLEVLNTGVNPVEISWEITKDIADVKQGLAFEGRNMPVVERRVKNLVTKKMIREVQRELAMLIADCRSPTDAVNAVIRFHNSYDPSAPECNTEAFVESLLLQQSSGEGADGEFGDVFDESAKSNFSLPTMQNQLPSLADANGKYNDVIDIVTIHRLCLEKLGKLVSEGHGQEVAGFTCLGYIRAVIADFRSEVDVVAIGLKLITEIMKYLKDYRETILHLVMDCIVAYAPPAAAHRPRDPLRLKSPEELFALSMPSTSQPEKQQQSLAEGAGRRPRSQERSRMPNSGGKKQVADAMSDTMRQLGVVEISDDAGEYQGLSRYGNFYGHSELPPKHAAKCMSQSVVRSDTTFPTQETGVSGGSIAHVTSRVLTTDGRHRPEDSDLIVMAAATPFSRNEQKEEHVSNAMEEGNCDVCELSDVPRSAGVSCNDGITEEKRVEPITASNEKRAIESVPASILSMAAGAPKVLIVDRVRGPVAGIAVAHTVSSDQHSTDGNNQTAEIKKDDEGGILPQREKIAFRIKNKDSEAISTSALGSSSTRRKRAVWKGTVGELGRAAPKKEEEVKIDFKKKIVYDPTQDDDPNQLDETAALTPQQVQGGREETVSSDAIISSGPASPSHVVHKNADAGKSAVVEKAEENRLLENENLAEDSGVPLAPSQMVNMAKLPTASAAIEVAPPVSRRRRRAHKEKYTPLPVVPCVVFRGLSGRLKQNIAMQQSFATLFKFISFSFGNRDRAFKMGILEELSTISTVCQAMPRVLEYFIWIVDAMYRDGFGEMTFEDMEGPVLEDPSMVVSGGSTAVASRVAASVHSEGDSVDTLTGKVIETISEMSFPSIDADGVRSESTPVVSIGTIASDEDSVSKHHGRVSRSHKSHDDGEDDESSLGTTNAVENNLKEEKNQLRRTRHKQLVDKIGLFEFDQRYVQPPVDIIIIAVAMVFAHNEIEVREKEMASRWLEMWDDNSRRYKQLVKKGKDVSGI